MYLDYIAELRGSVSGEGNKSLQITLDELQKPCVELGETRSRNRANIPPEPLTSERLKSTLRTLRL